MSNATASEGSGGILYYDGACPICAAEIKRLRRATGTSVDYRDIHDRSLAAPCSRETLLQTLHFEYSDGTMVRGLDANLAVWCHTRWGHLLRWLDWPVIRPLARHCYGLWARRRYRRLYPPG